MISLKHLAYSLFWGPIPMRLALYHGYLPLWVLPTICKIDSYFQIQDLEQRIQELNRKIDLLREKRFFWRIDELKNERNHITRKLARLRDDGEVRRIS